MIDTQDKMREEFERAYGRKLDEIGGYGDPLYSVKLAYTLGWQACSKIKDAEKSRAYDNGFEDGTNAATHAFKAELAATKAALKEFEWQPIKTAPRIPKGEV